jgi:hypothetical protein
MNVSLPSLNVYPMTNFTDGDAVLEDHAIHVMAALIPCALDTRLKVWVTTLLETGIVGQIVMQLCFPPKVLHFPPSFIRPRHIATLYMELYV